MKRFYTIAVLSVIGGVVVHLMVLLVIQIQGPAPRTQYPQQAPVNYIGKVSDDSGPALFESAALNDSAPLFMPTRWNLVSEMSGVASLKEATEIFQPFPAALRLNSASPDPPVDQAAALTVTSPELPSGPAFVLARYGRTASTIPSLQSRGPSFSLSGTGLPETASDRALPENLRSAAPNSLWSPVQVFLQLENGIPVGLPLVGRSSGFRDWDQALQRHFAALGFYRRLEDGYYQIWVYP